MTQSNLFGVEYRCIAADPPWDESGGGKIKRGANRHYPLLKKKEQIRDVMLESGFWRPAVDCHLWLWVTNNFLPVGLWLMKELGFDYKTNRAWAKMEPYSEVGILWQKQRHGLGQYMWGEHELLLFGTRGKAMMPPSQGRPGTLLLAPRTKQHSEKPLQAYADMEFISPGPRLEMFARDPRPGWDVWGLEADGSRVIADEAQRSGR
jgi:N6-adenosine-specific RNA methylase IME4